MIFFVDPSIDLIVSCFSLYSLFSTVSDCCLSLPLVVSILLFFSLIVLPQKETASSIKFQEKSFNLK